MKKVIYSFLFILAFISSSYAIEPLEIISSEIKIIDGLDYRIVLLEFKNNTDKAIIGAHLLIKFLDVFKEKCKYRWGLDVKPEWADFRTDDYPDQIFHIPPGETYKDENYTSWSTFPFTNPHYIDEIKIIRIAFEDGEILVFEEEKGKKEEIVKEQFEPEDPLKIESWKWSNVDYADWIKIEGYVKNYSKKTYSDVRIIITAEDANDNYLGNGDSYLDPDIISPEGTSNFSILIFDAQCHTNSLKISYKFDWD